VEHGGALITEYEGGADVYKTNFVARNRIVAVLITEAAPKSGSLHTARFALEQGIDVLAVPGNITSPTSEGTNNLIKSGATPITSYEDVIHAPGLQPQALKATQITSTNPHERRCRTASYQPDRSRPLQPNAHHAGNHRQNPQPRRQSVDFILRH
jgi:predicted Rossmann fold nucleotide-binding protein DprA/Smf involved in DNA uptake